MICMSLGNKDYFIVIVIVNMDTSEYVSSAKQIIVYVTKFLGLGQ